MTDHAWNDRAWTAFDITVSDHIAEVTLIGPGKGNAMGPDFWQELPELFGHLDTDPEVRAVVLTGSGKNFSYGLDLVAMGGTLSAVLAGDAQVGGAGGGGDARADVPALCRAAPGRGGKCR